MPLLNAEYLVLPSLVNIPTGITSYIIELNTCAITAKIKVYKSLIRKKKTKHDEIVSVAKPNIIKKLMSCKEKSYNFIKMCSV